MGRASNQSPVPGAPAAEVYGALASLAPGPLAQLLVATSPDDAFELVKERRLDLLDLGMHWHALHWLLARRASAGDDPEGWAVLGRRLLPALDRGRGAPGVVDPTDVPRVVAALAKADAKTARLRFDAEAMDRAGIHPATWRRDPGARPHELLARLPPLAAFYRRAKKSGAWVVAYRY